MIPIELNQKIRNGVIKTFPILKEIRDVDLRGKVIDAWTFALQENDIEKVEDMPGSGMPEASSIGDQSMHILAVTYNALSLYDNLEKAYDIDLGLDRDILIASAICHDVGKPYEYNRKNRKRWMEKTKETGMPCLRHPAYGTYIAITVGLPEEVVHVCACHSPEGRLVQRSAYATIVHYADDGSWFSLASIYDLDIPKL